MPAPTEILELVGRFDEHSADYRAGKYNETQLRRDFLDPFFTALGWDMTNTSGTSESAREVILEYSMKVEGRSKAPDYCFRSGTTNKFFVEAKKPSVNLKDDWKPAFQTRTYGWQQGLPFCVLTDFEEFAVYDCRFKPEANESAHTARTFYCKYSEYDEKWQEIESMFGRDAVLAGSLEQHAATKSKKGVLPFDVDFLNLISGWREALAQNIALRNRDLHLTQADLNYAVQMTIDRILFLRMCEDRELEPFEQLKKLRDGKNIYEELIELFRQADNRYNSGLFHFDDYKDRGGFSDKLTPGLKIDDGVLTDIIYKLYAPSPYNFRIMSVEILGQVYEQFLGKVIRLDGTKASVEEKPEVRKAGGVYYTPSYIVDYIVAQTVGKLCEGKTPAQVEKLKVLDPACGSGSFLIGAYNYLLEWHLDYYTSRDPAALAAKRHPVVCAVSAGEANADGSTPAPVWRLTTREKKRILLSSIYGVDIDRQAVEVTKLSLLLKMLEDDSDVAAPTIQPQLMRGTERLLPDLEANIKCGNSLIGHDFFQSGTEYSEAERTRINAFDWEDEFPAIMKNGGFDAVIGNPPYIRIQALKEWAPLEVDHLKKTYKSASVGNYDIYVVFVERALQLLNKNGRMGYILPHKFFNAKYGAPLRELMAGGAHLSDVVNFGHQQVFSGATTYTCLLFANQKPSDHVNITVVNDLVAWRSRSEATTGKVLASAITGADWNFSVGNNTALLDKLAKMPVKLSDVTSRIFQGIKTSADKIYIVEELERKKNSVKIYSRQNEAEYWLEPDLLHPLIKGGDSKRYQMSRTNRLILFPYARQDENSSKLIDSHIIEEDFPLTWKYLLENKAYLENRENGKMCGNGWYGYVYPKALDVMPLPKLFTPDIAARAAFSLDETGEVFFTGGVSGGYGILVSSEYSREYILGLLNSKVLEWIIRETSTLFRGGYYSFESRFIRHLPIRTINFSDKTEKAQHDQMVQLVERMLELNKQKATARTAQDAASIERQIAATDKQIDRLVYELYELSDEEIAIVEGATA